MSPALSCERWLGCRWLGRMEEDELGSRETEAGRDLEACLIAPGERGRGMRDKHSDGYRMKYKHNKSKTKTRGRRHKTVVNEFESQLVSNKKDTYRLERDAGQGPSSSSGFFSPSK